MLDERKRKLAALPSMNSEEGLPLPASKRARTTAAEVAGGSKAIGNAVRERLAICKWGIEARCGARTTCEWTVFNDLVVPNATEVVPAVFTSDTPVVLVKVSGNQKIEAICGNTRKATRMESWSATNMDLIYVTATKELRMWWTMY